MRDFIIDIRKQPLNAIDHTSVALKNHGNNELRGVSGISTTTTFMPTVSTITSNPLKSVTVIHPPFLSSAPSQLNPNTFLSHEEQTQASRLLSTLSAQTRSSIKTVFVAPTLRSLHTAYTIFSTWLLQDPFFTVTLCEELVEVVNWDELEKARNAFPLLQNEINSFLIKKNTKHDTILEKKVTSFKQTLATFPSSSISVIADNSALTMLLSDSRPFVSGEVRNYDYDSNKGLFEELVHEEMDVSYDYELECVGALE